MQKVSGEIFAFCFDYEREKFMKITGVDISSKHKLIETLLMRPFDSAKLPNKTYDLDGITVLQNVPKGILVTGDSRYNFVGNYIDKTAFIYAKEKFVNGGVLMGYVVVYAGTYDYKNIFGAQQRVNAYKFFDITNYKKFNKNDFYFYPQVRKVTLSQEDLTKIINKAFFKISK